MALNSPECDSIVAGRLEMWNLVRLRVTTILFISTDLKKLAEQLCLIESRRARNLGEWTLLSFRPYRIENILH